jgi:long-chain acyl-CoA synthetase
MHPAHHAAATPDKPAYIMAGTGEVVTYAQLDARSNQAAQLARAHGLKAGDAIALFMENSAAFFEIAWGAQRAGLLFACISTKLTAAEAAYIVRDCGAKLLFASHRLGDVAADILKEAPVAGAFSVDGPIEGFSAYEAARDAMPTSPIADQSAGGDMLYSSGTTGRPKGVKSALVGSGLPYDAPNPLQMMAQALYGITAECRYLSPAPLYHAAPLRWCMSVHKIGGTTVIMEKFDPEAYLALVERYRITDSQLVPTMFVRMLKLPAEARAKYDVSSLKMAIHAAAPCPVPVKEQMLAWWGPVIYEYYAGTEGNGFCTIAPQEWLEKKGSVGKAVLGTLRICDEAGEALGPRQEGIVYFEGGPDFAYHNSPEKTAESRNKHGWSTLGDVGYVDEDGYLFLTDRKAFMIISGGVNIYPQEIENLLVTHPEVADAAVFGVPNEDFGEEVKAVIQPLHWQAHEADGGARLKEDVLAFCRAHLSHLKCPKSVDLMQELPRHPTGKLYKRLLRDPYWTGRASTIV